MATFKSNCPHCDTIGVGFVLINEWHVPSKDTDRYVAARCGHCSNGVIGRVCHRSGATGYNVLRIDGDIDAARVALIELWPKPQIISAPEYVPENIENYFKQAVRALKASSWDAAGMMFRKVLDAATKALAPSLSKDSLIKRIDAMQKSGSLTSDLASWAHEIRMEGNDAAHDEEPFSQNDAEALKDFTEYFLIYTYSLPKKIEKRRELS